MTQPLVTIGSFSVTENTVYTPSGSVPLAGTVWSVDHQWRSEKFTPTWAIVAGIIGFFMCIVGIAFILIKEEKVDGWVTITCNNPEGYPHTARISIYSATQARGIEDQVNYVRDLEVRARSYNL